MTTPEYQPPAWAAPPDPPESPAFPPQRAAYPAPPDSAAPQPPAYPPQSYPAQSYPAQSYPSQPAPPQSYPPQTYPSQTYPSQTYPSQTYPSQTYPSQTYPSQTYPSAESQSGQDYPTQTHPSQTYPSEPYASQQYGTQQPYGTQQQYGTQQPYGSQTYPSAPYGSQPYGSQPFGSAEAPGFPPPEQPVTTPPKKSVGGRIAGFVGGLLVIVLVAGLKFGLVGIVQNLFDRGPAAPTDPFEGTVAASYPTGEAGIVVPEATEVPGFTQEEVAAALDTVKQAMIAGRLDDKMLYDHDRTALRALFSPVGADELDAWFDEKVGGVFATMIAPGYKLSDHPIRVSGSMTFQGTIIEGIRMLEVHTKFVWVYPFEGELKSPGDHLVTLNDDLYWLFPVAEDVVPEAVGMYPDARSTSFAYNIDCDLLDQDLLALGKPEFSIGGEDIDPADVMDPNNTTELPDNC